MYKIMWSANIGSFTFFFLIMWKAFISFSCIITLTGTFSKMLNRSGHPYFVSKENAFILSLLDMIRFWLMPHVRQSKSNFYSRMLEKKIILIMKGQLNLLNKFSVSTWDTIWLCPYSINMIHYINWLWIMPILHSQINPFDQGIET